MKSYEPCPQYYANWVSYFCCIFCHFTSGKCVLISSLLPLCCLICCTMLEVYKQLIGDDSETVSWWVAQQFLTFFYGRTKAARQSCQLHAIGLDFCFKIPSLMPHMIESQVMVFCRVLFFGWFFWCHRLQNPFFATFLALLQVRKVIESWMSSTPDRTKFSSKKFTARIDINWDWISSCFSSMCFIYHSISWFVSVISHFGITYLLFWGLFFLFIRMARLLEACSSNKAKHLEFSGPKNQPEDCCHLGKGKCRSPGLSISVWESTSMIFNFEIALGWKWQRWQGGVIVEENLFELVISVKCFKDAMFSHEQLITTNLGILLLSTV